MLAVNRYSASAVCVDGTGVGGGVVDQLRSRGVNVHEVQFGGRPDSIHLGVNYMNKRAEIWGVMREWLATGSIMPTVADISAAKNAANASQLTGTVPVSAPMTKAP